MITAILWLISVYLALSLVWVAFHRRARDLEAAWISVATLVSAAFFILLVVQPAHS